MRSEHSQKATWKIESELNRLKIRIEEKDELIEKYKKDYERLMIEVKHYKKELEKQSKYEGTSGPSSPNINVQYESS